MGINRYEGMNWDEMVKTILTSRVGKEPSIVESFVDAVIDTEKNCLPVEIKHFAKSYKLFETADKSCFMNKVKASHLKNHDLFSDEQLEKLMWEKLAEKVRSIAKPLHAQVYKVKTKNGF